jgi:short-subunit dehydrogenase
MDDMKLDGRVVVITGASSGIGRAAALRFAEEGARLVLAARRADVLEEVARACRGVGAETLAVPTDVTDAEAVQALADEAVGRFGAIDIWISNAGTGVFGPYSEARVALHRKTVEVNLFGAMHSAAAVLPIFLRQRQGVLINNISLGGWAPTPYAAAYTASKFGLRGFTASLRAELSDQPDIHVCGVFPAIVDTPGFAHGANVSGKSLNPGPHLYTPEDVAETFVRVALKPRAETAVGWPARAAQLGYVWARAPMEWLSAATFRRLLSTAKPAAKTDGAIMTPSADGVEARGGWIARNRVPPAKVINRIAGGVLLAGIGLALGHRVLKSRATSSAAPSIFKA